MVEIIDRPATDLRGGPGVMRRDAETHTFPRPGFPTGIITGPALLLIVALVGAAGLMLLRTPPPHSIPEPATREVRNTAQAAADRIGSDLTTASQSLSAAAQPVAAQLASGSERALNRLGKANPTFDGMAVVDPNTSAPVTTRGADVPVPTATGGEVSQSLVGDRIVTSVPLSTGRTLVASSKIDLVPPAGRPDQRVVLVDGAGEVVSGSSKSPAAPSGLITSAAERSAADGRPGALVDDAALHDNGSALDYLRFGTERAEPVATVGFAKLTGDAVTTDLSAMVIGETVPVVGSATHPGLVAGIALAVAGVIAFLVLQRLLVRPVRRLRDDVDDVIDPRVSQTAAIGASVRRSRLRETDRVARGLLAHLRRDAEVRTAPQQLRTVPLVAVLAGVALLTAAPLAAGFVLIGQD